MPEAIWITFAFGLGLLVKLVGLPPLVGYLAAGFVLSGIAEATGVVIEATDVLQHIAPLGVLLLLFTVGLKLKLRSIVSPEVIGGSLLHFGITCAGFTPGVYLLMDLDWSTALMLAIRPELVRLDKATANPAIGGGSLLFPAGPVQWGWKTDDLATGGWVGRPDLATPETGQQLLTHALKHFQLLIAEMAARKL